MLLDLFHKDLMVVIVLLERLQVLLDLFQKRMLILHILHKRLNLQLQMCQFFR